MAETTTPTADTDQELDPSAGLVLKPPVAQSAGASAPSTQELDPTAGFVPKPSPDQSPEAVAARHARARSPQANYGTGTPEVRPAAASVSEWADQAVSSIPGIGDLHSLGKAVHDYADKKAQQAETEELQRVARGGKPSPVNPVYTPATGYRMLSKAGGVVQGLTSAESLGTAAGFALAAPVMGAALVTHGGYVGAKGWSDFSAAHPDASVGERLSNPDFLENELNALAEVVGGVAGLGEKGILGQKAIEGWKARGAAKATAAEAALYDHELDSLQKAIPASKTVPWKPEDWKAGRPYILNEHVSGDPLESVESFQKAADSASRKIDNTITEAIKQNPNYRIKTMPLHDAMEALRGNVRRDFLAKGLAALENYEIGFERADGVVDPPLTLEKSDIIRHQLNAEMDNVLSKNKYDRAKARITVPEFAAYEAVAESLRDGIYNGLDELGYPGAQQLRLTQGSIMKMGRAAGNQIFNAEKQVRGSSTAGPARKAVATGLRKGSTLAGAAAGSVLGPAGAAAGAEIGAIGGEVVARKLGTEPLTRNALIKEAFKGVEEAPPIKPLGTPVNPPKGAAEQSLAPQKRRFRIGPSQP